MRRKEIGMHAQVFEMTVQQKIAQQLDAGFPSEQLGGDNCSSITEFSIPIGHDDWYTGITANGSFTQRSCDLPQ